MDGIGWIDRLNGEPPFWFPDSGLRPLIMVFMKDLDSNGTMTHERKTEFQKIRAIFIFLLHQKEAVSLNRSFDAAHVIGFSLQAAFAEQALIGFQFCSGVDFNRGHDRSSFQDPEEFEARSLEF